MKRKILMACFLILAVASIAAGYRYYHFLKQDRMLAGQCCDNGAAPATCTGSKYCKACRNCKYCNHCAKKGGSCGVCK